VLGWVMLAATIIPAADAAMVITHHDPKVTAYGAHGAARRPDEQVPGVAPAAIAALLGSAAGWCLSR
jgi:hypothetical protein